MKNAAHLAKTVGMAANMQAHALRSRRSRQVDAGDLAELADLVENLAAIVEAVAEAVGQSRKSV